MIEMPPFAPRNQAGECRPQPAMQRGDAARRGAPAASALGGVALSIVIPAYNEAKRIDLTLHKTLAYLDERRRPAEIVVVDDGSFDETCAVALRHALADRRVRCVSLGYNRGKGAAVRAGVGASRGERILYTDADSSTPIAELDRLWAAADRGADVVFGSRGPLTGPARRSQGPTRAALGRAFSALVGGLLLEGVVDSQCGFKLFARAAALAIFARTTVDRFCFDVEVLTLALALGLRIEEVPVAWRHDSQSRVSPLVDAPLMLYDLLKLRARHGRRRAAPAPPLDDRGRGAANLPLVTLKLGQPTFRNIAPCPGRRARPPAAAPRLRRVRPPLLASRPVRAKPWSP